MDYIELDGHVMVNCSLYAKLRNSIETNILVAAGADRRGLGNRYAVVNNWIDSTGK